MTTINMEYTRTKARLHRNSLLILAAAPLVILYISQLSLSPSCLSHLPSSHSTLLFVSAAPEPATLPMEGRGALPAIATTASDVDAADEPVPPADAANETIASTEEELHATADESAEAGVDGGLAGDDTDEDDDAMSGGSDETGEDDEADDKIPASPGQAIEVSPGYNPLNVQVDCTDVESFDYNDYFGAQDDDSKVYLEPAEMPEGIFKSMGFSKFTRVFGVPIVATRRVSNATLAHAVRIFAAFLDNDRDGEVDRQKSLELIKGYNTVIAYVNGVTESEMMWMRYFPSATNEAFRKQFVCNMHFFEQWASDANPDFHHARNHALVTPTEGEVEATSEQISCTSLSTQEFDWPLWYFSFTVTYYGFLDEFDEDTRKDIHDAMIDAKRKDLFDAEHPDDMDMEMADFFVWSLTTRLGGLQCHCNNDIVTAVWKLCTPDDLYSLNQRWSNLLGNLKSIPHNLPDGTYHSSALVEPDVSEA